MKVFFESLKRGRSEPAQTRWPGQGWEEEGSQVQRVDQIVCLLRGEGGPAPRPPDPRPGASKASLWA